jgi:phage-related protein
MAAALGVTEGEVRDLAISVAGAGDPLNEVIRLMELGRQQGIESAEGLKAYAGFWDTVGDATGESAAVLAEAGTALRVMGIAAGEEGEALGALGFVQRETTGTVGEFLQMLQRVGPDLNNMGMSIDDTAAILGVLEREMGLTGRVARTELTQAIGAAEGDMNKLLETLGVTTEQFEAYRTKVSESSGVIEENAAIHAESYTVMQELQHAASELTYRYGDLIGMVGNLSPLMMALGPIIKGVSLAKAGLAKVTGVGLLPAIKGATAGTWAFTAALLANPMTWVVVGIMALVAAIILLWKNWDEVSVWLMESWAKVKEGAVGIFEGLVEFFSGLPERIGEFLRRVIDQFTIWRRDIGERAREAAGNLANNFINFISDLPDRVWRILSGVIGRVSQWGSNLVESARSAAGNLWTGFKRGLGISSPSYLERAIDAIAERSHRLPEEMSQDFRRIEDLKLGDSDISVHDRIHGRAVEDGNTTELLVSIKETLFRLLALFERQEGEGAGHIVVPVNLDGREIARVVAPEIDRSLFRRHQATLRAKGSTI